MLTSRAFLGRDNSGQNGSSLTRSWLMSKADRKTRFVPFWKYLCIRITFLKVYKRNFCQRNYQCYIIFHLKENIYVLRHFVWEQYSTALCPCAPPLSLREVRVQEFRDTFSSREQCHCLDYVFHCCLAAMVVLWCLKAIDLDDRIIWKGSGLLNPNQSK